MEVVMHHDASRRGDDRGPTERDVLGQVTDAIDEPSASCPPAPRGAASSPE
jgi:hypothetical protein